MQNTDLDAGLDNVLGERDESARAVIARRVGRTLAIEDLPDVERRAAETLARALVRDAIERVRREFSEAVRHSRFLPKDVALRIAHDVDSVACPFLMDTEVFSEADWAQLVSTLSKGALAAAAERRSMPESLALSIIGAAQAVAGEALVENAACPMTKRVCQALIERFESEWWVLDKLAQRNDLVAEVAVTLTGMVSAAARRKLLHTYRMGDFTEPVSDEAEVAALLALARETAVADLPALSRTMMSERKLTHFLLLRAMRENLFDFAAAAVSARAGVPMPRVRLDLLDAGPDQVNRLLAKAGIPPATHDDFREALRQARQYKERAQRTATG